VTTSSDQPLAAPDATARIRAERTHQVFLVVRVGHPVGGIGVAALGLGLWWAGGSPWLAAWVGWEAVVLAWELWFVREYFASSEAERAAPHWERKLGIACGLFGVMWAALPLGALFGLTPPGATAEAVVVIAVVGLAAATLGGLAVSGAAYHALATTAMLGVIAAYALRGGAIGLTMAALGVAYTVFLGYTQRTFAAQFAHAVRTRLHNEELIARLRASDAALQRTLAEHELLFDLAMVGIADIRDGKIVRANRQLEAMLGHEPDALVGQPASVFYAGRPDDLRFGEFVDPIARGVTVERDLPVRRRDGSTLWVALACRAIDPSRPEGGVIAVLSDITDRIEREAAMHRLAHEDALTGLPNRRLLEDRLNQALLRTRRSGGSLAVLLIDLDGFKQVNDAHGHGAGDRVLIEVARRLLAGVRASDTVSRLGGDEFVIVLDSPVAQDVVARIAEQLVDAIAQPIEFKPGVTLAVTASIGVSIAPVDGVEGELLLRHADEAMYGAKSAGRGVWRRYDATSTTGF